MSKPLQVGSVVEFCECFGWQSRKEARVIGRFSIVRETETRWYIGAGGGDHFRKDTLSQVPRYLDYDRFIRPVAE